MHLFETDIILRCIKLIDIKTLVPNFITFLYVYKSFRKYYPIKMSIYICRIIETSVIGYKDKVTIFYHKLIYRFKTAYFYVLLEIILFKRIAHATEQYWPYIL